MLYIYQSLKEHKHEFFVNFITNYQNFLILHTITSGHYWRNSNITELQLLSLDENHVPFIEIWKCEREEDEYEILTILSERLKKTTAFMGFNSTSFHIPYLKKKYHAYGLEDPFMNHTHYDIFKELKQIGTMLHISLKLKDLQLYYNLSDETPEIKTIFCSLQFFKYKEFFLGNFSVKEIELDSDQLYVTLDSSLEFMKPLHFHHSAFYLILENDIIKLSIRLFDGKLRVYYSNFKDYYYLPDEEMLIHKSMSSGIAKERLVKATAQTCFQQIPLPGTLANDYINKYLKMLFKNIYEMQ